MPTSEYRVCSMHLLRDTEPSAVARTPKDLCVEAVGYEHVAGAVGDHEWHFGSDGHCLRGHPAGPEDRGFELPDGHGVAVVGSSEIGDAEGCRVAYLYGGAVHVGELPGHRNAGGNKGEGYRAHAHHQWAVEPAHRGAFLRRAVHRHITPQFEVANGHPGVQ